MSVLKYSVVLLLLAALCTDAKPTPEECEALNKRLQTKDLHTIYGHWVLVWGAAINPLEFLRNLTSSHVELKLLPDQKTIEYLERNSFEDKSCMTWTINMSQPSDPTDALHQTLTVDTAIVEEKDGVVKPYNETGSLEFYQTCADCLMFYYKSPPSYYLLTYKRDGHHTDVDQLKAAHSDYQKQTECLDLPHEDAFKYDGVADFCHKKSAPAPAAEA